MGILDRVTINGRWYEWLKRGLMGALAMGILFAGAPDTALAQSAGKVIKERQALMKSNRSEEHTSELPVTRSYRMPSSA